MKIVWLCFWILFLIGCQSSAIKKEDTKTEVFSKLWEPSSKIEKAIEEKAIESFPGQKVYGVTVTRLRTECILNIYPVRGNDFIRNNGKPTTYYESHEILYLIYCGLESLNTNDSLYIGDVQKKLDSTCLKYGIKYNPNMTHDETPLFVRVQGDSLTTYETGSSKEFYMIYNGFKEIKETFMPPVIK